MTKTAIFNRTQHKILWNWVADQFKQKKIVYNDQWPEWIDRGGKLKAYNHCFACEYNEQIDFGRTCDNCPLPDGCYDFAKKLATARAYKDYITAELLAREMADTEIREDVVCI